MVFIDTNYFLRFLLKDIKNQHQEAKELIADAAQGKLKVFTSTIVFFEIYWVLSSYYGKNKTDLVSILQSLLNLSFIEMKERLILENALEIFTGHNISLEDSYNLTYAVKNEAEDFKTFDIKLYKLFTK